MAIDFRRRTGCSTAQALLAEQDAELVNGIVSWNEGALIGDGFERIFWGTSPERRFDECKSMAQQL